MVSDDQGDKLTFIVPDLQQFFSSPAYAVVGASANRDKFGNKVLRCYQQDNMHVYPVNPHEEIIEGLATVKTVAELPRSVKSISIVTPPSVTEQIVMQAIQHGIQNIWMQPGAESDEAVRNCKQHNLNVIADGRCILIELNFHE